MVEKSSEKVFKTILDVNLRVTEAFWKGEHMEIFLSWLTGVVMGVIGLALICVTACKNMNEDVTEDSDDWEDLDDDKDWR